MITEQELTLWLAERTLTDPVQKAERYDRLLDELRNAWDLLATMSRSAQRPFGRPSDPVEPEIGLPDAPPVIDNAQQARLEEIIPPETPDHELPEMFR